MRLDKRVGGRETRLLFLITQVLLINNLEVHQDENKNLGLNGREGIFRGIIFFFLIGRGLLMIIIKILRGFL